MKAITVIVCGGLIAFGVRWAVLVRDGRKHMERRIALRGSEWTLSSAPAKL